MKKKSKLLDNEDRKSILYFTAYILFFGALINFSLNSIFGIKFDYFSWIAWGALLWIAEKKLVQIIRTIFVR